MHIVDISIVVAFLATTLWIGFRSGKNIKTFEDYAIGNRKFTDFAIFCTVAATVIGGTVTIGNVGKAYDVGIVHIIVQLGAPIAYFIVALFLARRFSLYYGCCSLGDMFFKSYGMKGKILIGFVGTLYEIISVGIQFIAMGTAISVLTKLSYEVSLLLSGGIVLFYTGRGGIRGVTFTDVLQFIVLMVALPILLITVLTKIGGFSALWSQLPHSHITVTGENFNRYIFLMLPMLLATFSPTHTQRLLMTSNYNQGIRAYSNLSWILLLVVILSIFLGLSARVLLPGLVRPDQAVFVLMTQYLPVGVFGISLAGIFAILMSSADSNINSGNIIFINDLIIPFYRHFFGKDLTEAQKLRLARIFSVLIGVGAYIFAKQGAGIFETRIFLRTVWFSVILSPLYFLLFNMKISVRGLATSAVVGLITFVMWNLNIKPITHIDGLFPGFFANIITVLFFYFLGGKQKVFSDQELAKVRNAEIIQKQEKNPIFKMEALNNVLLGFSLVALQLMPLIFSAGTLTHSKLFLSLINGSIAILLIFGSSLEVFAEAKHLQYLRWVALFFCLPATSAYLLLTSPENGLHLLTLLFSFIVMLASVERKYERKICFVCILTAFLTIGFYHYLNCQLCWPETFAWQHSFYLFGFLVVLFLIRSNLNSLHKEKELLIYRERCTMARSLSHDMSSPLLALRLLIDQAPTGEFNPQKYQLLKKIINEMGSYFDNFILASLDNTTQLQAQNLNQCLLDCIEKQKILHPNIEIQLKSKTTLMARIDAVLFRRIINNLLNVCTRALSPNTSSIIISLEQDLQGNPQISLYSENQGFSTSTLISLFATDQSLANDLELGVSFHEFQTIIESWNGQLTLLSSADTSAILISLPRS